MLSAVRLGHVNVDARVYSDSITSSKIVSRPVSAWNAVEMLQLRRFWISLAFLAFAGCQQLAAQGPENVLLVVNERSPLSKEIGAYYQSRRNIPEANVCRIQTDPDSEQIGRSAYTQQIAAPISGCLRDKGLVEQVLYIVLTQDIAIKIPRTSGEELTVDSASVDSELALLYGDITQRRLHPTEGALRNPFFAKRTTPFTHPEIPIYMVTRLAAYDLAGVKAMIDRSLAAENRGNFIIDGAAFANEQGEGWLLDAALRLPDARRIYDTDVDPVYDAKQVIGLASWGSNDKARKRRTVGFTWLPGAIATDFVSTNARTFQKPPANWSLGAWDKQETWFRGSPQSMTLDYIAEGASAATGHVDEPYLQFTPRPDLMLPAYYAGRNLAESFYLSIPALSWQNIVVGDPLMSLGPPETE